jgi:ABC-2 type transport system permease protein
MSAPATPPASGERVPSVWRTLRRLFLALFLRGRTSRGLQKKFLPKSVGGRLAGTLATYALFGLIGCLFGRLGVFGLSLYLHAMTFGFLALFVASSAGEMLFNKEEADILQHRPVGPRDLLWAKISVLIEVSLWVGLAFNLGGFITGFLAKDGGGAYPLVHLVSVGLESVLCAASVVLVYEICLRWCGRERLDGLMTTAQVVVAVVAVVGSQLIPQLVIRTDSAGLFLKVSQPAWWMAFFPPVWFAGFDDAFAGARKPGSWLLAALAVAGTGLVAWLAFARLAGGYEAAAARVTEVVPAKAGSGKGRRWIEALIDRPPLRWWLRDPVVRASFLLTAAYLYRDRDVKLRVYPAIAPFLAMPLIFLLGPVGARSHGLGGFAGMGAAFSGCYLALVPMMAIGLVHYSQQWQASDLFRWTPLVSPAPLCHGARRAVLCFLGVPLLAMYAVLILVIQREFSALLLLLPGMIAMPVFSLVPSLDGSGVPLVSPTEEAKGAGRGLAVMVFSLISFVLVGLTMWSWKEGWFALFVVGETVVAVIVYATIHRKFADMRWRKLE